MSHLFVGVWLDRVFTKRDPHALGFLWVQGIPGLFKSKKCHLLDKFVVNKGLGRKDLFVTFWGQYPKIEIRNKRLGPGLSMFIPCGKRPYGVFRSNGFINIRDLK